MRSNRSCSKTRWLMTTVAVPRSRSSPVELPEGEVGLPVEALVGLVEEQNRRVVHEGQGQAEFLLGPARQGADALAAAGGITEPVDQLPGPPGAADPVRGLEVAHVLIHGERLVQDNRLRAVARPAGDDDAARVGAQVAREDPEQGRLAGPVLPDHRDQLPRRDLQVNAGQHLPPAKRFADAPCCQRGHGLRPLSGHRQFLGNLSVPAFVKPAKGGQGAAWRVRGVLATTGDPGRVAHGG